MKKKAPSDRSWELIQLAREVADALYHCVESWSHLNFGCHVAYLLRAIIEEACRAKPNPDNPKNFMELYKPYNAEEKYFFENFYEKFPKHHPAWKFLKERID